MVIKTVPKKKVLPIVADVEPEKAFWLNDGRMLKNLKELAQALETIDAALWEFHVNQEKNDFANWVEDVFGQKQLGSALRKVKNPKTAAKRIKEKINAPRFWSFLM